MDHVVSRSEAHHRLLEGLLLRLARSPSADAFVLRGGMRVRQWVAGRPVEDVDLVCALPFNVADLTRLFGKMLSARDVGDGVDFDEQRLCARALADTHGRPALRLSVPGWVDGVASRLNIDLTFGLELWPAPQRTLYQAARGAAHVWMACPETITARKVQVLTQMGPHFRPKDLDDLWMLTRSLPSDTRALGEAIEVALASCAETLADVRVVFADGHWWSNQRSEARWQRCAATRSDTSPPPRLCAVLSEIRATLRPVLGPL